MQKRLSEEKLFMQNAIPPLNSVATAFNVTHPSGYDWLATENNFAATNNATVWNDIDYIFMVVSDYQQTKCLLWNTSKVCLTFCRVHTWGPIGNIIACHHVWNNYQKKVLQFLLYRLYRWKLHPPGKIVLSISIDCSCLRPMNLE